MHELSVAQGLCSALEKVASDHGAKRICRAVVEVGELSNIVPQLLDDAFGTLREIEPILEGCELDIRTVPLTGECKECGRETAVRGFVFRCEHCGSGNVKLLCGEELMLRDVELEIEEVASS